MVHGTLCYIGSGAQTGVWAGCTEKSPARLKAGHAGTWPVRVPNAEIKPSHNHA